MLARSRERARAVRARRIELSDVRAHRTHRTHTPHISFIQPRTRLARSSTHSPHVQHGDLSVCIFTYSLGDAEVRAGVPAAQRAHDDDDDADARAFTHFTRTHTSAHTAQNTTARHRA